MAKCSICNSRKGKRLCQSEGKAICSPCCGSKRAEGIGCDGCVFYAGGTGGSSFRKYHDVPRYEIREIAGNSELEHCSLIIETAIRLTDELSERELLDRQAISIYEVMMDHFHYKCSPTIEDPLVRSGWNNLQRYLSEGLPDKSPKELSKLAGTLHYAAKRRSQGGREYLDLLVDYIPDIECPEGLSYSRLGEYTSRVKEIAPSTSCPPSHLDARDVTAFHSDELPETCPKCKTGLEKKYVSYIVEAECEGTFNNSGDAFFCPNCSFTAANGDQIDYCLSAATQKNEVEYVVTAFVDLKLVPKDKREDALGTTANPYPIRRLKSFNWSQD